MLTGKFKQNAFIRHEISCLALFLRSHGFTSEEILACLAVIQSFHQNTPSFVLYGGCKFDIVSTKEMNFVVKACDHRNYTSYQYILERLNESGELDLVCRAYLWTIQMYVLLRFYCYACQLQLGSEHYNNDAMIDMLVDDLFELCASIMTQGKTSKDQIPNDVLLPYVEKFVDLVFKIDYSSLRSKLSDIIESAQLSYCEARAGLALQEKNVEMRMLVLVMYKAAMNEFVRINSGEFSESFGKQIFSMTCQFICDELDKLPKVFTSNLGMACEVDIVNFYKDLFYVFNVEDIYACYRSIDEFNAGIFNDICLSTRGSLAAVSGDMKSYNPFSCQMSVFAFYDVSLAVYEIFRTRKLNRMLQLEYMLQLYKTLLAQDVNEMHVMLVTALGKFNFYYIDENKECKCGLELLLELMSLCYHAAFVNRVPIEQVSMCYGVCYNELSDIANMVGGDTEVLLKEYRKVFAGMVKELHCQHIDLSEVKFEKHLFFILVQHLLCGEILGQKLTRSNLAYDVLLECKKTHELKAQQASVMLCRVFKRSNGVIDNSVSNSIGGLLIKLLFGNFLERNLILKMLNIFHIAYKRSRSNNSLYMMQEKLKQELASYFSVILNLLKYVQPGLPYDFSPDSLEKLSDDHCEVYNQINNMLNICAKRFNISLRDLEMEYDVKFCKGFADILGDVPVSFLIDESDTGIQVFPCKCFDKESSILLLQLVVSYVCLYNAEKIGEDLYSADLSSPAFLLFNILTYPGLSDDLVDLCYKTSLKKSIAVEKMFVAVLKSLNSEKMLQNAPMTSFKNKAIIKGRHIITERLVKLLIREDGCLNINEQVLKNACLSIIKLRELNHADAELDIRNARNIAKTTGKFLLDYNLLAAILPDESCGLGIDQAVMQEPLFSQFFSRSDEDRILAIDEMWYKVSKIAEDEKPDPNIGIIELSDIRDESTSTSSLIITDDKVSHKYKKLTSDFDDTDFKSEIDRVEVSKMEDGLRSYFGSDFYRKKHLDKKKESTSLFDKDVCVYATPVIALVMGCISVLFLFIAVDQENTTLFVTCVAVAVVCLIMSVLCCCITAAQICNQKDDVTEEEGYLLESEHVITETSSLDVFQVKPNNDKMH
ncbi:hypothetical protein DRF75_01435 [Ehrlichia minasensis]|uniref:Uncharacterized protein n=1 Tax=Ehrlichia minasensis TaxID=1242993 RepID=A0A4Q6IC77_9RICK|nr:hypothetical protein [Ehrlichia minasensis]RZB12918.1 hypothetical protein DRF75_01435 [Ehrlichia minasensis]